jgi:M6 family metalloprotease-like protein
MRAVRKYFVILAALLGGLTFIVPSTSRAQATADLEGTLSVIWGNPRPGGTGGGTHFSLTTPNGSNYSLQVSPADRGLALQGFGKRVRVHGRFAGEAGGSPAIAVDQLELVAPTPELSPQAEAVTIKRVLFILVKYKGDTQAPGGHNAAWFKNLTNPLTPVAGSNTPATINGYFNKTSYGKLRWDADAVGWYVLSGTKAAYAPCGWAGSCAQFNLTALANEATALAVANGVDVSVYANINIVINNDLDCCAWGGGFTFSGNGKFYGATWEPPWGQEAGVYAHEMSHSLGLPHSGWTYYAYDSPWDILSMIMSDSEMSCGTYKSANDGNALTPLTCTEPGNGYIAPHKLYMKWIPVANQVVVSIDGTQNVVLEALARPLGTGKKVVKICLAGQNCNGHFITVEARIATDQFDQGLLQNAVVIHDVRMNRPAISGTCFFNNQSGWAVPADALKGDFNKTTCSPDPFTCGSTADGALCNSGYTVGKKYVNATYGVTVEVLSSTATTFTVKVTRASPP